MDRDTDLQTGIECAFTVRAARANPGQALAILERAGRGKPLMPGDELDAEDRSA